MESNFGSLVFPKPHKDRKAKQIAKEPCLKIDNLVKSRVAPFYEAGKGFLSPAI